MLDGLLKPVSPQSMAIYNLLKNKDAMTARDIGQHLQIFPHGVYRAIKRLTELGIVQQDNGYPVKFKVAPPDEAKEKYSMAMSHNFQKIFIPDSTKSVNNLLNISYVQNRTDLLEQTDKDIQLAKNGVNIIVSGLEIPAERILTFKLACDRGVKIRIIVQNLTETRKEMFANWKKIGVKVRYFPNMEARVFTFDEHIVYFTSYNPDVKEEAIGVRFDYAPYTKIMNEIFEQRWSAAKEI